MYKTLRPSHLHTDKWMFQFHPCRSHHFYKYDSGSCQSLKTVREVLYYISGTTCAVISLFSGPYSQVRTVWLRGVLSSSIQFPKDIINILLTSFFGSSACTIKKKTQGSRFQAHSKHNFFKILCNWNACKVTWNNQANFMHSINDVSELTFMTVITRVIFITLAPIFACIQWFTSSMCTTHSWIP